MEKKHVLKEIPIVTISKGKTCNKCRYGEMYTVRARFRIGKKIETINDRFQNTTVTKQQLNIIVGQICIECGNFVEDKDFINARINSLKKYAKGSDDYSKRYKKLLKAAKSKAAQL